MMLAPGHRHHPMTAWALVTSSFLAWVAFSADSGAQPSDRPTGAVVDLDAGGTLYARWCAACHGDDGDGVLGADRTAGPPIDAVDAAYVDLTLRTGRMPLVEPRVGIDEDPVFEDDDGARESLVAWMTETFELRDSRAAEPITGDVAEGRRLYAQHCAACHGGTGAGGVSGDGTRVRPVTDVGAVAAAEAMRVGPFRMPVFDEAVLPDGAVGDIAVFVDALDEQPTTALGLTEVDRITHALLALAVVVAVLAVVLLAARHVDVSLPPDDRDAA